MLSSLARMKARALVLLTDGHDFELVNPAKTGFMARQRQTPIYAVALGKQAKCRRVGANHQLPAYTYVKQKRGSARRSG